MKNNMKNNMNNNMNTGWITDRVPYELKQSEYSHWHWDQVWATSDDGQVYLRSLWLLKEGTPWQPMIRPEPYVKPDRWEVRWYGCGRDGHWEIFDVCPNEDFLTMYNVLPLKYSDAEAAQRICDVYNEVAPMDNVNINGWITDRLPTKEDIGSIIKCVWGSHNGKVDLYPWDSVTPGTPWKPVQEPEPYVKPKTWTSRWNGADLGGGCWILENKRKDWVVISYLTQDQAEAVQQIEDIYNKAMT